MTDKTMQVWDLWFPHAAATGLPFARGRIDPVDVLLVHAAPNVLDVKVYDGDLLVAQGMGLQATDETPIARLTRHGERIERQDIWPGVEDMGKQVLLPGGEAGTLIQWWHAPDHSEWRWQVELYNKKE